MRRLFWLSDRQFELIKPHLPYRAAGRRREDDRRIISGIIHVLQSGCRWRDCPPEYGPSTTVYNRYNRWSQKGHWQYLFAALTAALSENAGTDIHRRIPRESPPLRRRRKRGASAQAIGPTKGVSNTKFHAISDEHCRPLAFYLTPGQTADITGAVMLAGHLPDARR